VKRLTERPNMETCFLLVSFLYRGYRVDAKEIEAALKEPFNTSEIEWRVERAGRKNGRIWALVLAYVTSRAIQDRLDAVCGVFGWENHLKENSKGGFICGISIPNEEGRWVTKWDGSDNTNIEAIKGGISGSIKRAASQWGIGRYLYHLDDGFAIISDGGKLKGQFKENNKPVYFKYDPPKLPGWALPNNIENKLVESANQIGDVVPGSIVSLLTDIDNLLRMKNQTLSDDEYKAYMYAKNNRGKMSEDAETRGIAKLNEIVKRLENI